MDKMKMESANITDMNIEKIAALFPNCITETADENGKLKKAINFEMLRAMLSEDIAEGDEAYEFTWVGKKAAIAEANRPIRKTLRPCVEESVNWDTTENLYIEGDNLEVLKLLQESYLGKVKMIYIDPPYNTGNDFIYRDDFAVSADDYAEESGQLDEDGNRLFKNTDSNGRFHSDWCSMIYSRLMLARNLLAEDGAIFISIDDCEVDNLREISSEVFGADNFVASFIWNTEGHTDNQFSIKINHEYILLYAKNIFAFEAGYVVDPNTRKESNLWKGYAENSITKNGQANPVSEIELPVGFPCKLSNGTIKSNYPCKEFFEEVSRLNYITRQITEKYQTDYPIRYCDLNVQNNRTMNKCTIFSGWANANKLKQFISGGCEPILEPNGDECSFYLSERGVVYYYKKRKAARNIVSVLRNMGTTESMRSQLERDNVFFSYPKPLELIKYLIRIGAESNDSIILDFFSGSATTAHAVMAQNFKDVYDGKLGKRKFIMVQLPEPCDEKSEAYKAGYKNICEIGKERIRRAGKQEYMSVCATMGSSLRWDSEKRGKDPNYPCPESVDIGFRVLKLDDTNMQDVYYTPAETDQQMLLGFESNIKPDRTDLDLLFGCLLDWGLPLSMPYSSEQIEGVTVHTYNDGDLIACFDKAIPESVIKTIAKRQPLRVVFRDDSFADSPSKINVSEIFKMLSPDTRVKVI